ncbi:MAG: hypothetical protein L3I91_00655 [Mycoplasma sp.]
MKKNKKKQFNSLKVWNIHFYLHLSFFTFFTILGFAGCFLETFKIEAGKAIVLLLSFLILLFFSVMWLVLQFLNKKLDYNEWRNKNQLVIQRYQKHDAYYLWFRILLFFLILVTWFLWIIGSSIKIEYYDLKMSLEWIGFNWFLIIGLIHCWIYYKDLKIKHQIYKGWKQ